MVKTIQDEFRKKIGEVAYTSNQVSNMLLHLGLNWYSENKIRYHAIKNNLTVSPEELEINPRKYGSNTKYWIPASGLESLIEKMKISVEMSDFEDAANDLEYQV